VFVYRQQVWFFSKFRVSTYILGIVKVTNAYKHLLFLLYLYLDNWIIEFHFVKQPKKLFNKLKLN